MYLVHWIADNPDHTIEEYAEAVQKAKKIHRKEIINSFHSGMIKHSLMELNDELPKTWEDFDKIVPFKEGKEYYKQKFKK